MNVPWGEIGCGAIVGLVAARTEHLLSWMRRRGHLSLCAWCRRHVVDLHDRAAEESMRAHITMYLSRRATP